MLFQVRVVVWEYCVKILDKNGPLGWIASVGSISCFVSLVKTITPKKNSGLCKYNPCFVEQLPRNGKSQIGILRDATNPHKELPGEAAEDTSEQLNKHPIFVFALEKVTEYVKKNGAIVKPKTKKGKKSDKNKAADGGVATYLVHRIPLRGNHNIHRPNEEAWDGIPMCRP